MMDQAFLDKVRGTLEAYIDGHTANDVLTIFLTSGEKFKVQRSPGQAEGSIFFDFVDTDDNDVSVRLDQVAAIKSAEGGAEGGFEVL